jgi:diguanylate cyclase (GGDEF)-like protein
VDVQSLFIGIQAAGTLLIAGVLWQLTRVLPGRFLGYWVRAGVTLAAALIALRLAVDRTGTLVAQVFFTLYLAGVFHAVFLTWAGLRDYVRGRPLVPADYRWQLVPAALAVGLPFARDSFLGLMAVMAPVLTVQLAACLWATRGYAPPAGRRSVGMPVVRAGLIALVLLFGHYGPALLLYRDEDNRPPHLLATAVFDSFGQLVFALGLVMLVAERIRDELEDRNRQLADVTRQLAAVARTDALTGLLNRRAFEELLTAQAGRPFTGSLAVLDLNDLKPINDKYLHPAGDAALQIVARGLRNRFRVGDPLFRVGGDEFVVVLPGRSVADLSARLRAVGEDLASVRVPGVPEPLTLAVAWGVAGFAGGDGLAAAYHQADRAMYEDKARRKGGR